MSDYHNNNNPIAVFDSGVGGISVLREMVRIMPNENFLYYGDTRNAPYGIKTNEEIKALTIANVEGFLDGGCKAVAIACNTATAAAVKELRIIYPDLPLVGIEPAVKPAVEKAPGGRILVMATPVTVRSEKYHILLDRYKDQAEIESLPCPGLMDFVEAGDIDSPRLNRFLDELLYDHRGDNAPDVIVLGCTHYPFLKEAIRRNVGEKTILVDGGEGTARELKRRLTEAGLLNQEASGGSITYGNSMNSEETVALCKRLMSLDI